MSYYLIKLSNFISIEASLRYYNVIFLRVNDEVAGYLAVPEGPALPAPQPKENTAEEETLELIEGNPARVQED